MIISGDKEYASVEEAFADWKKEKEDEKKNHPLIFFAKEFRFALVRFFERIGDGKREVKFAWQRAVRGYDDRASWSIDYWMAETLPPILRQLKKYAHGVPMQFLPDDIEISNYRVGIGRSMFRQRLEELAQGFEEFKKHDGIPFENMEQYQRDYNLHLKKVHETLSLFENMLHSLWD